ncbi:MAG: ABC transporter ATP-binding protein [Lachnospiraceae bacterium]|nr:ABC transporter ATP-binding protein [Lachnospiraceae bacterium]
MSAELLSIKGLKAWYKEDKKVLKDFSIELGKNEIVGLIGLNGAGKTTFVKVLTGLLKTFEAEEIKFEAAELDFRNEAFKKSRYAVFAEDDSFKYFTFREYMEYVSGAYGVKMQDTGEMVKGFNFSEYENTLLKDLSTGNRKKAFLITAFALLPRLLLLDEPVNGLDFTSTEYLYGLIAGYKEYGTILFSSHILESITLTSDRVLVLENGAIAKSFEGEEITADSIREALRYEDVI